MLSRSSVKPAGDVHGAKPLLHHFNIERRAPLGYFRELGGMRSGARRGQDVQRVLGTSMVAMKSRMSGGRGADLVWRSRYFVIPINLTIMTLYVSLGRNPISRECCPA